MKFGEPVQLMDNFSIWDEPALFEDVSVAIPAEPAGVLVGDEAPHDPHLVLVHLSEEFVVRCCYQPPQVGAEPVATTCRALAGRLRFNFLFPIFFVEVL